jgi:acyl-CoA thioesterase-1
VASARSRGGRAGSGLRWLLAGWLSLVTTSASAGEQVYVALGGSGASPGVALPGDPARLCERLRSAGVKARVVDLTAPTASIRDIRRGQLMRALAANPTLVTLALGPADACGSTSLDEFSRDMETVADLLERTRARVLISMPNPASICGATTRIPRVRTEAFKWAIVRTAKRHHLTVVVVAKSRGGRSWLAAVGDAISPTPPGSVPPTAIATPPGGPALNHEDAPGF